MHVERHRAALESRELQDAVGEAREAHRLVADDAEALLVGRQHAVLHRLDGGLDRLQRRAQLVRDVGGEPALQLAVGLDSVGHLVERLPEEPDLVLAVEAGCGPRGRPDLSAWAVAVMRSMGRTSRLAYQTPPSDAKAIATSAATVSPASEPCLNFWSRSVISAPALYAQTRTVPTSLLFTMTCEVTTEPLGSSTTSAPGGWTCPGSAWVTSRTCALMLASS